MSMSIPAWSLVLLAIWAIQAGEVNAPSPPPPSVEEVENALAARDAAWETLTFRATYHDQSRVLRGEPTQPSTQAIDVVQDRIGRIRTDMIITPITPVDGSGLTAGLRVQATLDSEGIIRILNLASDGKTLLGKIQSVGGMYWFIPPLTLLHLDSRSPEKYLAACGFTVDGVDSVSGHDAIRLQWQADDQGAPSARRGTYWTVPALGFAVVKSEMMRRPDPQSPWRVVEQTEAAEFSPHGSLWLPSKVKYIEHTYYDDGGYELTRETEVEFEGWEFNKTYSEDTFKLDFPDGTLVHDQRGRGLRYVKGRINEGLVKSQVTDARGLGFGNPSLEEHFERVSRVNPFVGGSPWARIALGITGVGFALLAFWLIKRRRAESAEP